MWSHLRRGNFDGFKFKRQVPIEKYIADFCCNERKLIIELDGNQHKGSVSDRERNEFFTSLGYKVLRFWDSDVDNNLEGVLEIISRVLIK